VIGLACLFLAALTAAIAIGDHRDKQDRVNQAELDAWYCIHQDIRCGGRSPERIERRWNERQVGYEAAVAILTAGGVLFLALASIHRQ
jgi:hypothetical protein